MPNMAMRKIERNKYSNKILPCGTMPYTNLTTRNKPTENMKTPIIQAVKNDIFKINNDLEQDIGVGKSHVLNSGTQKYSVLDR